MLAMEKTKEFKGLYHVLGGTINAIEGTSPDDLRIKELISRIKKGQVKEIILALNPDLEGETTALYLNKQPSLLNITITRLAKGLPTGADLEYADEITLANALKFRNKF